MRQSVNISPNHWVAKAPWHRILPCLGSKIAEMQLPLNEDAEFPCRSGTSWFAGVKTILPDSRNLPALCLALDSAVTRKFTDLLNYAVKSAKSSAFQKYRELATTQARVRVVSPRWEPDKAGSRRKYCSRKRESACRRHADFNISVVRAELHG